MFLNQADGVHFVKSLFEKEKPAKWNIQKNVEITKKYYRILGQCRLVRLLVTEPSSSILKIGYIQTQIKTIASILIERGVCSEFFTLKRYDQCVMN